MAKERTIETMKVSSGAAGIMAVALMGAPIAMMVTGCAQTSQVAATVNGENIDESTIDEYIANFRKTNGLDDDQAWAQWMVDNGRDAESVRSDAIDYFVQIALIDQDAKSKGIEVTDEDVNNSFNEIKDYYGFSDEEFDEQLSQLGYTQESYRDYLKQSLIQEKLMEEVSGDVEVSADEVLTTANSYTSVLNGAKNITSIVVEDEALANDIKSKADAGEDFATLASENSTTTDYDGWDVLMGIDQTVYEALTDAKAGDVTAVTPSDDGTRFFIIKVNDVLSVDQENGFASVDEIPEDLYAEFENNVKQSSSATEFDTYVQGLKDAAEITINPMPENAPYNVSTEGIEATTTDDQTSAETVTLDENGNPVETGEETVVEESGEAAPTDDAGAADGTAEVQAEGVAETVEPQAEDAATAEPQAAEDGTVVVEGEPVQ